MHPRRARYLLALLIAPLLGGCELLGMEDAAKLAAAREAEGKAVGGACRHSGRALEDCYLMNPKAQKAAIYAGWRDMDGYMRENKIEVVLPDLTDAPGSKTAAAAATEEPAAAAAEKNKAAAEKKGAKHSAAFASPVPGKRRVVA
jgi:hypothetical protein